MTATNPIDLNLKGPGKSKHSPYIGKARCPYSKCAKQTTHILYFLVGPNLDIKSMYGALCENHANQLKEDYSQFRECVIVPIDEINKRTEEREALKK